ncbi:MAG: tripartite tricarboxylate transporter substrate binding protein [Betaproteobacteria bacterium]|nr:tripartite tricarboxylate transporter substrate binding protein [Betaproteobacteria bacterium]
MRSTRRNPARLGLLLLALAALAQAQPFPSRPITIVVPFPPGTTDTTSRLIGKKMSENIGQPVVIENKPGGGGISGAVAVKNATPNGYTVYVGHVGSLSLNVHMHQNLGYDPIKDFQPITTIMSFSQILMVPASSPAKSVAELVAYAKSAPGGLSYTSQGPGTISQLQGETIRRQTGAPLVHIPMKGGAAAVMEVVTARADLIFTSYFSARGFIRDGKLRMLAIGARARSKMLPDIPTLAEAGIDGVDFDQWFGMLAPARTPDAVIRRLNEEVIKAVRSPEIEGVITQQAAEVITSTPEEFARLIASDSLRYAKIVRQLGVKID